MLPRFVLASKAPIWISQPPCACMRDRQLTGRIGLIASCRRDRFGPGSGLAEVGIAICTGGSAEATTAARCFEPCGARTGMSPAVRCGRDGLRAADLTPAPAPASAPAKPVCAVDGAVGTWSSPEAAGSGRWSRQRLRGFGRARSPRLARRLRDMAACGFAALLQCDLRLGRRSLSRTLFGNDRRGAAQRGHLDVGADQLAHMGVALDCRTAAEHDARRCSGRRDAPMSRD